MPPKKSKIVNYGNHWLILQNDKNYGPGKRLKISMVSYQRKKDDFNDKEENYIYLFGGIKIVDLKD